MGVHVVGEIRAEIDTGLDGESTIVIRCDPERTTNDLGVPVRVQTSRGDVKLNVHIGHVEIPLAKGVVLRVEPRKGALVAQLCVPLRNYLGETPVYPLDPEPLKASHEWKEAEFEARLSHALERVVRPFPAEEIREEVFRPGPMNRGKS